MKLFNYAFSLDTLCAKYQWIAFAMKNSQFQLNGEKSRPEASVTKFDSQLTLMNSLGTTALKCCIFAISEKDDCSTFPLYLQMIDLNEQKMWIEMFFFVTDKHFSKTKRLPKKNFFAEFFFLINQYTHGHYENSNLFKIIRDCEKENHKQAHVTKN